MAAVPPTSRPPSNNIVGAFKYPDPLLNNTSLLTLPLEINALAVAPVPELPANRTIGSIWYPDPPSIIFRSVIVNPTLSIQCFHGYSLTNGSSISSASLITLDSIV